MMNVQNVHKIVWKLCRMNVLSSGTGPLGSSFTSISSTVVKFHARIRVP
jgi:hypothetical protein